jgi:ribonucleotide monophosphatase NagD (HAD superfamily)
MKTWQVDIDKNKESCYIFDLDGTLAINVSGLDWYHPERSMRDDKAQQSVLTILKTLRDQGFHIIILTARDLKYKKVTLEWLADHDIRYNALYMRRNSDRTEDSEYKKKVYIQKIKPKYNVFGVFEDRTEVVEMWRRIGLTCFQMEYRH